MIIEDATGSWFAYTMYRVPGVDRWFLKLCVCVCFQIQDVKKSIWTVHLQLFILSYIYELYEPVKYYRDVLILYVVRIYATTNFE